MLREELGFIGRRIDTITKLVLGRDPLEPGPGAVTFRRFMEIVANLSILVLLVVLLGKLGFAAWGAMTSAGVDAVMLDQIQREPRTILALLILAVFALMILTGVTELLFRLREYAASLQLLVGYGVFKVIMLIIGILADKPDWKELIEMVAGA
jgi:hypothetical protein